MNAEDLRNRSKQLAINVMLFLRSLPGNVQTHELSRQLFRSVGSVAVNYRAVGRARSRREFIAKLSIVVEEIDETVFWLELLKNDGMHSGPDLDALTKEATEYFTYSLLLQDSKGQFQRITKSLNH